MKKIFLLPLFFVAQLAVASSDMNAGLAIMCYNEAAIQASISLSVGADQASEAEAARLKARQSRLLQSNEELMMSETACAANTTSADMKNNCIRENYVRGAMALVLEFNLQHLKVNDEACSLTLP